MDRDQKWKITSVAYLGTYKRGGDPAWCIWWERIFKTGGHPTIVNERDYFSADDALGALVKFREEMARLAPSAREIIEDE